jgi:hypothetical protein
MKHHQQNEPHVDDFARISVLCAFLVAAFVFWFSVLIAIAVGGVPVVRFFFHCFIVFGAGLSWFAANWGITALAVLCPAAMLAVLCAFTHWLAAKTHDMQLRGCLRAVRRRF